jgi:hypothetical protein
MDSDGAGADGVFAVAATPREEREGFGEKIFSTLIGSVLSTVCVVL